MRQELTWRNAIDHVLEASSTALHYNEITERIIEDGLRQSLGATPSATVNALISASIKHDGSSSPYIRVAKGTFALRTRDSSALPNTPKLTPDVTESEDKEEQYDIVSSFGMYWRKDAVDWTSTPKLLGMQQIGATPVDFYGSSGVCVLK